MCGIIAIFGEGKNLKKVVKTSLENIKHRGNNLYEYSIFESAAMGANRLAIIDRPNGKQPVSNENNDVFSIQNGEIFNYKELKEDLTKKGHDFKTDCDTEILVHLWEEYEQGMINKLDSEMFAFVIYDKRKGNFFIARDRLGVKPLYYAFDGNGRFYVASEIKALSYLKTIKEIKEFPPGHYYYKGNFTKYYNLSQDETSDSEYIIKDKLKSLIQEAVKKRVRTDLPIGVFLSGGVDSSLIMEIATRYHPNVTAIILGTPESEDYLNALKLCKEKEWKYVVVNPEINYQKSAKEIIYYSESYEPNIIRHSFASNLVSKKAKELGLKIVLVGEGSDELFGGYNEFLKLSPEYVNFGCIKLLESMSNGHMMRVDKLAMKSTIEVRSPFYDIYLTNYALSIPGNLKIKDSTTKYILREIAKDFLPEYIANRYKSPFANGAGMKVGTNFLKNDGVMSIVAKKEISDELFQRISGEYKKYNFTTKEEVYYFLYYLSFRYGKFKDGEKRLIIKDSLQSINLINQNIIKGILSLLLNHKRADRAETFKFNDISLLKDSIEKILIKSKKLEIVGYWGVETTNISEMGIKALEQLSKLQENMRKYYPNCNLILILMDIHGKINQINKVIIKSYFKDIRRKCKSLDLGTLLLSDLWIKYGYTLESINKIGKIPENIKNLMFSAAQKHYRGQNIQESLLKYIQCSRYDKIIMCNEFQEALFFTYNGFKWKTLLPSLPTISLWVVKKGNHIKPWYS